MIRLSDNPLSWWLASILLVIFLIMGFMQFGFEAGMRGLSFAIIGVCIGFWLGRR